MLKALKHSCSLALVLSLLFSTVGYSITSFACTMKPEANCRTCKEGHEHSSCEANSVHSKANACCKANVEYKVVKSEFEKPYEAKASLSTMMFAPLITTGYGYEVLPSVVTPTSSLQPVDRCILLSTFLI